MSGHETIRVLEVEVDSSQTSSTLESNAEEGSTHTTSDPETNNFQESSGGSQSGRRTDVPAPTLQTVSPAVSNSVSVSQPQAAIPISVQSCPQVLTQESLASLMTGMMAQTGSLGQPLLIPLSVGNQGGLAVLTLPTTNVATLPAFAAANSAGNLLKLPFTGLQAATLLNSIQPQLQTNTQTLLQPVQTAMQQMQTQVSAATPANTITTSASQTSISLAALQTAGLSINPAIINAASFGAQPQFLSSLMSTPIISSAMSSMAGITSQIITNAQGQVIGTLPLLLNPASLTGAGSSPSLPLQGLQVQTVSPQLLLNAQGQLLTVGNGPSVALPSASVLPKAAAGAAPATPTKPNSPASLAAVTQSPVVIAPQPPAMKTPPTGPITCGELAKVGQLVSKPQHGVAIGADAGINLEEIREFAKNFKIRRLSLGLTQTQVGQALTATEGPAYSQSAICRFEKLDITPKSAQKLKPVLEKWLAEAEHWNQKGQQNLMEFVGGEPSKKRKRRTSFTPQAIEVLNSYFEKNALPTGQEITEIARELNYDREVVRVWFCNRRQTLKNTSKINIFQV
ncbi:POU domain, class 6, transcription factor 1 isoform X2 [Gouania willdenowi]|nr:POU domain, class 6, transcription factor 1 isoform X2 [Gouania willdenowi]XP_028308266.1 POU domain, class 6, transcription factor 1 isoform X2 [Gouania willdenowi]